MRRRERDAGYGTGRVDGPYYQGGYPGAPPPPGAPWGHGGQPGQPDQGMRSRLGLSGWSALLLVPLLILIALFFVILFVGRPYVVHGSSMEPTLHTGDRVFVIKYRLNTTPNRGDVVVLKDIQGNPDMLIKRVVGISGDRITLEKGKLVVDGKYTHKSTNPGVPNGLTQLVPDGDIFVMGDNESRSYDSRIFGPVPLNKVVGKAVLLFWPFTDFKVL